MVLIIHVTFTTSHKSYLIGETIFIVDNNVDVFHLTHKIMRLNRITFINVHVNMLLL